MAKHARFDIPFSIDVKIHPSSCHTAIGQLAIIPKVNEKKGKRDIKSSAKIPEDYDEPAVVIDTCHGWKGLEAKHLWVPMAEGVFPHARSVEEGGEAIASERRLAYVALTRGRESVTVISPDIIIKN